MDAMSAPLPDHPEPEEPGSATDATDATGTTDTTEDPTPDERPLSRFAERFRIPLGVVVTVLGLVLAVVFARSPIEADAGTRGTVAHIALVALWVMVAAAGATWAAGAPRRITNLCAAAGIAAYAVVWVAGL